MAGSTGNTIIGEGVNGSVWSSTISTYRVQIMAWDSGNAYNVVSNRVGGRSVRCIKD
jgi:hypothetical protein